MKKSTMERLLKKALEEFNVAGEIGFMSGCLSEGDFGTYAEGYGVTIEGSEDDAWELKNKLEEWFNKNCEECFDFYYGKQTADRDRNYDMGEDSYKYSHVEIILSYHKKFEK